METVQIAEGSHRRHISDHILNSQQKSSIFFSVGAAAPQTPLRCSGGDPLPTPLQKVGLRPPWALDPRWSQSQDSPGPTGPWPWTAGPRISRMGQEPSRVALALGPWPLAQGLAPEKKIPGFFSHWYRPAGPCTRRKITREWPDGYGGKPEIRPPGGSRARDSGLDPAPEKKIPGNLFSRTGSNDPVPVSPGQPGPGAKAWAMQGPD